MESRECVGCGRSCTKSDFSGSQWKKGPSKSRCSTCAAANAVANGQVAALASALEKSGISAKQSEPTLLGDFSSVRLVDNVLAVCGQGADDAWRMVQQYADAKGGKEMAFVAMLRQADGEDQDIPVDFVEKLRPLRPFVQFLVGQLLIDPGVMAKLRRGCDRAGALRYWREAASKGLALAMVGVGSLIRDSDPAGAMMQWQLALRTAASPEAAYNLGVCYGLGHGVKVDLAEAARFYEHAASIDMSLTAREAETSLKLVHALILHSGHSDDSQEGYQALARKNLQVVRRDLSIAQAEEASAAPRPPSPPDAKPKPRNVKRPKDLPDLYPGPPPWLANSGDVMRDMGAKLGVPSHVMNMMLGSFLQQRKSDERWRHLTYLYRGEEKATLPLEEHHKRWTEAGWDLSRVLRAHPRHRPCTWREFMDLAGGPQMQQNGYTAPSPPLPRFCDYCGRQCTAECRCGEAYCDKDCQAKDWPDHRQICETVADNSEMAMRLTKHSWGSNGALM